MRNTIILLITVLASLNVVFAQKTNDLIEDIFVKKTTIGGYGELHYNQSMLDGGKTKKTLDFHRFVLFFSHSWNEKWSFKSEVEIEHNFVESGQGELAIEQAYLNFRVSEKFGIRAGVILNPVGIINEIHEPPTFLSVERPEYSKYIIPTTWFGNGAAIFGNISGFDYVFTAMEGLNGNKLTPTNIQASAIRKGRQEGFKSNAKSILLTARLNYTRINGIKFGGSFSFNNAIAEAGNIQIGLSEFHFEMNKYNVIVVGEIANIAYGNNSINNSFGYYVDLGYDLSKIIGVGSSLVPFVRYTDYNTASSTKTGGDSEKEFHKTKWMVGVSFKPIDEVVLKVDYAERKTKLSSKTSQLLNFGIGYMF